ncbi:MAG: dihydrofolate reductase [Candidatus Omnitrophica bacterium]|nr:dihydrofolate reductase [Candidatus Omnitrophota bacterium]
MRPFDIIVAIDKKNGIGKDGKLPWVLPSDMKHFKSVTLEVAASDKINAIVMGRKTWESIPERLRPLAGRLNVVLTRNDDYVLPENVLKFQSLEKALKSLNTKEYQRKFENIFVIGGASVYAQAIVHPLCRKIYLTAIDRDLGCDVFFPEFIESFKQIERSMEYFENDLNYSFATYERR